MTYYYKNNFLRQEFIQIALIISKMINIFRITSSKSQLQINISCHLNIQLFLIVI